MRLWTGGGSPGRIFFADFVWPHRLVVRTRAFQACGRGSIPRGATSYSLWSSALSHVEPLRCSSPPFSVGATSGALALLRDPVGLPVIPYGHQLYPTWNPYVALVLPFRSAQLRARSLCSATPWGYHLNLSLAFALALEFSKGILAQVPQGSPLQPLLGFTHPFASDPTRKASPGLDAPWS